MSSNTVINPKDCSYGCNTHIYWNVFENAYFEVFAQKKHICPNRVTNNKSTTNTPTAEEEEEEEQEQKSNK